MYFIILIFSAWYIALVIHELGHFFAVKWVDYKMESLVIGPFAFIFSEGAIALKLQPSLFKGYVTFVRIISPAQFCSDFIVFSAGIIANLFFGVLFIALHYLLKEPPENALFLILGIVSIAIGIINLYPRKYASVGLESDASQLINTYKRWKLHNTLMNYIPTPIDFNVEISKTQNNDNSLVSIKFYNDDVTPMHFVVTIMESYLRLGNNEAVALMLAIHKEGTGNLQWFDLQTATKIVSQILKEAQKCNYPFKCEVFG